MNIIVEGTITKVLPLKVGQKKDGSAFHTQDYVITDTQSRYADSFAFSVMGEERVQEFAPKLALGSKVAVHIAPMARTATNQTTGEERAYNTLSAWKVENPAYDLHTQQLAQQLPPVGGAPIGAQMQAPQAPPQQWQAQSPMQAPPQAAQPQDLPF